MQQSTRFRIHRGFPQLFRIHFAQSLEALDGATFFRLVHEPRLCLRKVGDGAAVIATANLGTRLDEFCELRRQIGDGFEFRTGEKVCRQDLRGGETMMLALDFERGRMLRCGRTHAELVERAPQPAGVDLARQAFQPCGRAVGLLPALTWQRRHIQHGGQDRAIETQAQPTDLVARKLVILQQFFQPFGTQWRCIGTVFQFGILDCVADQIGVQRGIVLEVHLLLALLEFIQRRQADIDIATIDQYRHLPIKERQQQSADVRSIDVCIGHDDDTVVTQFVRVELVLADTATERGDQGADFRR